MDESVNMQSAARACCNGRDREMEAAIMTRIVVDPVTRIEGHLRIEAVVEERQDYRRLQCRHHGSRHRKILKGRDPRDAWAFVERVCGVCTTVHALASVRAVEDALRSPYQRTPSSSAT